MFEFEFCEIKELPRLAWLAEIRRNNTCIKVWHGSNVEVQNKFFVAGVWDGNFMTADFDTSSVFWGTGAKIESDSVYFVTPSHALERLVLSKDENEIVVSNSIPFLLEFKNMNLDSKIHQYEKIFCSILKGPKKYQEEILLEHGNKINQYIVSVLNISEKLDIKVNRRKDIEEFTSYDNFYNRMLMAVEDIKKNSISDERKKNKYGVVSTISSGYDSCTCAAIAKKIGCEKVVTLMSGKYDKDSGELVAKQLGYENVIKRDCRLYKEKKDCIDAEYVSSGEQASQLQFCVFEDIFEKNIVFFGSRGSYWDRTANMSDEFEMKDYYYFETDVSWTENALKNGYIVAPLPTYGSSKCVSIRSISNSAEMEKWMLNTTYDKPIPRRILEDEGVNRNSFGMVKYGGGFSFCYDNLITLKNKMSKEGYESFCAFVRNTKKERKSIGRLCSRIKFFVLVLPVYLNAIFKKLGIKAKFTHKVLEMTNPGAPSDLIFWSMRIMKERYRSALNNYRYKY